MGFFRKDYTSADFDKLREKRKYAKLIKLLKHKELPVARMAEEALHKLIEDKAEAEHRIMIYRATPWIYDGMVEKLKAAQSARLDLNIEPIVRVFVTEREPLRREKEAEQEEVNQLSKLLTQVGVTAHHQKNVRDLLRLMEPDEEIDCALDEGTRGTMIVSHDFSLHTNKGMYILRGLANHEDWGSVTRIGYDAFSDIEETGVFIKKYQVTGEAEDDFAFTVERGHRLLQQLGKYGTDQFKDALRELGLLEEDAQLGLLEEEPIS